MIPMDDPKARQVWSRVMNVPCPSGEKQTPQLTAQHLAEMAQGEWQDAAGYRALAACAPQCARGTLLKLACDEAAHAKQLAALYYIKTGKKFCPEAAKPDCAACLNERLRQRYEEELRAQAHYQEMAALAGAQSCTFEQMARDECRHAQQLYKLLQQTL